jgi:hypothetical protein
MMGVPKPVALKSAILVLLTGVPGVWAGLYGGVLASLDLGREKVVLGLTVSRATLFSLSLHFLSALSASFPLSSNPVLSVPSLLFPEPF